MFTRYLFISATFVAVHGFLGVHRFLFSNRNLTPLIVSNSELLMSRKSLEINKAKYEGRELPEDTEDDIPSAMYEAAMDENDSTPVVGQILTGRVIGVDDKAAYVEIGGKTSGYLPLDEASLMPIKRMKEAVQEGQYVTVEVIGTLKGIPVVSLRSAHLESAWDEAGRLEDEDEEFEVVVLEINRGGAVCTTKFGLRAFLPTSQCVVAPNENSIGQAYMVS